MLVSFFKNWPPPMKHPRNTTASHCALLAVFSLIPDWCTVSQAHTRLVHCLPGSYQTGALSPQAHTRLVHCLPGSYQTGALSPRFIPDWFTVSQAHTRLVHCLPGSYQTGALSPRLIPDWCTVSQAHTRLVHCLHRLIQDYFAGSLVLITGIQRK